MQSLSIFIAFASCDQSYSYFPVFSLYTRKLAVLFHESGSRRELGFCFSPEPTLYLYMFSPSPSLL